MMFQEADEETDRECNAESVDEDQDLDPLTQARSQARQAVNIDTTNPTHYNPTPSTAQISRLRSGYSSLMRTLKEERRELVEPQNGKLLDLIEQANELHLQVQRTVDATLDARFMAASADLGVEKLQTLPLAANPFTVKDFCDLIGRVMKGAGGGEAGLEHISRVTGRHWRGVMGMETMIGLQRETVDFDEKPKKTRTKRTSEDAQIGAIVKPTVLSAHDLKRAKVKETTDLVIEVYEQLEVMFQKSLKLALLNVICDPHSFSRSVEVLFYVSFLVADGRVSVDVDDDDVVWLSMSSAVDGEEGRRKRHKIVTLSLSVWRQACQQYRLTEPLIKL